MVIKSLTIAIDDCLGTVLSRLEATDPDDETLSFAIVGDSSVLAASLLRLERIGDKAAAIILNAQLNPVVSCNAIKDLGSTFPNQS